MIWSTNRSADALHDLVLGTRVIFAAHEDTLTQRTDTDETTGATSTILVAVGHFYDVLDDTRDAAVIYGTIEPRPLELVGTVVDVEQRGGNSSVTLTMPRHGQSQPIQTRWPASIAGAVEGVDVGDELLVIAEERSLSWTVDIDGAGRRAVVPAVTGIKALKAVSKGDVETATAAEG
ncbi:Hypothetical protein CGLY_16620 (plasmid) [Corynebacterium glyciniphilum AJ 3170]|uniref:Uncharacterized protein n=1 Tax=Corynebacterium glyciniphilum AJ 3170 TaxID=1404245 RepID=X5DYL7_9CORY|nr:hypothetical protein [Corynebacterium glyciniphilum]AHW65697.1 Hypothetical protein CGLY_16620 [Corynebacterium glyciniphilum AJ 3170]